MMPNTTPYSVQKLCTVPRKLVTDFLHSNRDSPLYLSLIGRSLKRIKGISFSTKPYGRHGITHGAVHVSLLMG